MNNIIRKIRRIILEERIRKCEARLVRLNWNYGICCDNIIDMIMKRGNELKINQMKLERDWIHGEIMKLMDKKYDLKNDLRGLV